MDKSKSGFLRGRDEGDGKDKRNGIKQGMCLDKKKRDGETTKR